MGKVYLLTSLILVGTGFSVGVVVNYDSSTLTTTAEAPLDPEAIVRVLDIPSIDNESPWLRTHQEMGVKKWIFNISDIGCKSARVHISSFHLKEKDQLLVYGLRGTSKTGIQKFRGKGGREGHVYTHRVWADALILKLSSKNGDSFFVIRYVQFGDCTSVEEKAVDSSKVTPGVCGKREWKNAICYLEDYPETYRRASGVVQLRFVKKKSAYVCTGFKLSDDGRFMTNWHCLGTQELVRSAEIFDHYDSTSCVKDKGKARRTLHGDRLVWTSGSGALDASIFTVKEKMAEYIPCLPLYNKDPQFGQQIDLVEHPLGKRKKIAIRSNEDKGGFCTIDEYKGKKKFKNYWSYKCDMAVGASGSPVFDFESGDVVALNSFIINDCPNFGTKLSKVKAKAGHRVGHCSRVPVVDAALRWSGNNRVYIFRGNKYWRYDDSCDCIDSGPWSVTDYWPGLPSDLDAALVWTDGKTYFFKGSQYYKYNDEQDRVEEGYPRSISSGWAGVPSDIDAALTLPNNGTYFFKGKQFWTYTGGVNIAYPLDIEKTTWPGIPSHLDAALLYSESSVYFFKKKQYYKYGTVNGQYPLAICEGFRGLPCY